jgi:hypothetical protein
MSNLFDRIVQGGTVDRLISDTLKDAGGTIDEARAMADRFGSSPVGQDVRDAAIVTTVATVAYVAGRALWRRSTDRTTGE